MDFNKFVLEYLLLSILTLVLVNHEIIQTIELKS
jgi:hypothetical protein